MYIHTKRDDIYNAIENAIAKIDAYNRYKEPVLNYTPQQIMGTCMDFRCFISKPTEDDIKLASLDPETATFEEVNALHPIEPPVCDECGKKGWPLLGDEYEHCPDCYRVWMQQLEEAERDES